MPEYNGEIKPTDKLKLMTRRRAEIIRTVLIPMLRRMVFNEMDKKGIGPYSLSEIEDAVNAIETIMRKKLSQ